VRREVDSTAHYSEHVVVTVSSGTVEVGPPSETPAASSGLPELRNPSELTAAGGSVASAWTPKRLVKGQELTYSSDGPQGTVASVNLKEVSAWQQGRLEFRHSPLSEVIPRVNRYSRKPIALADDGVADIPYGGTVFERQVEDWLQALQTTYPISVTETADHYLLHYDRAREATLE